MLQKVYLLPWYIVRIKNFTLHYLRARLEEKVGVLQISTNVMQCFAPETAHRLSILALKLGFFPFYSADDPVLQTQCFGLNFPNPLGIAAGFDKDAEVPDKLLKLGFGYAEVGSVTPSPQLGNPVPRLFRLKPDRAVINRLGFNSSGLGVVEQRLSSRLGRPGIVGVNLGANKDSSNRARDFEDGAMRLAPFASYLVINVSTPNTPGLRDLQKKDQLAALLKRVRIARNKAVQKSGTQPPVLVKIAPDFNDRELAETIDEIIEGKADGIIVSNTTIKRPSSLISPKKGELGGLSGKPLFSISTCCLARIYRATSGKIPLIGVGGIDSGESAYAKIRAGASLLQLYTGLIYEGPNLVSRICKYVASRLKDDGFSRVDEAVGLDAEKY